MIFCVQNILQLVNNSTQQQSIFFTFTLHEISIVEMVTPRELIVINYDIYLFEYFHDQQCVFLAKIDYN